MKAETLLAAARASSMRAYAPYSGFSVGAALLTEEGAVITGSNTENASYGMTVCAERNAVYTAVHTGHRNFKKLAVAADSSPPPTPCGACRQVLWELAGNIEVISGNYSGEITISKLSALLPEPFGSSAWDKNPVGKEAVENSAERWRVSVSFYPVGYVVSGYKEPLKIPANYRELLSQVIIEPELEEGLYRLEEEEKINVISYLHRAKGYSLKEKRSGRGNEVHGVFACRAPLRPNSIAQSTVELVDVNKNILTVRGLDLIDGTPVLDIKTVMPR